MISVKNSAVKKHNAPAIGKPSVFIVNIWSNGSTEKPYKIINISQCTNAKVMYGINKVLIFLVTYMRTSHSFFL